MHFSTNILLKFTHFAIWKYWWWAQVQWIIVWIRLHNKYAECSKSFSPPQRKVFFKKWDAFFAFCNVILGISNTSFDNSMKWMNKMWISFGYNGEKYLNEFNFPWKKKLHCIFLMIYNFTITITIIHFAICKVQSDNLNHEVFHKKLQGDSKVASGCFK